LRILVSESRPFVTYPGKLYRLKLEFSRKFGSRELTVRKSRYTEEQIIGILKQHEAGVKTADVCREHGISAATFYGWKQKFGGMDVSEAQRLKALEDENRRLKVGELNLHGEALKGVIRKPVEACRPKRRRGVRLQLVRLSERPACKLLGVERSSYRYEPTPDRNAELREEFGGRWHGKSRRYGSIGGCMRC
jgi:putative transposase